MAKPELGIKRMCLGCGARFYDLQQTPIVCPSCGAEFDPESAMKLKRSRSAANDDRPKKAAAPVAAEEAETEDLDDDEDEDVLEDTSDLDDDDEDVPGVVADEDEES